jgi:hypothetical protein
MKIDGFFVRRIIMKKRKANIWIDGSYIPSTKTIGCGIALYIETERRPHRLAYSKQL